MRQSTLSNLAEMVVPSSRGGNFTAAPSPQRLPLTGSFQVNLNHPITDGILLDSVIINTVLKEDYDLTTLGKDLGIRQFSAVWWLCLYLDISSTNLKVYLALHDLMNNDRLNDVYSCWR